MWKILEISKKILYNIYRKSKEKGMKKLKQLIIDCIALVIDINTMVNVELLKIAEHLM